MNIDEIKQIIELMQENDLAEFEMEKKDFRIALRKSQPTIITQQAIPMMAQQVGIPTVQTGVVSDSTPAKEEDDGKYESILSPMVGTFYTAPSPDSEQYVEVGDEVDEESVVCILEAMKVMNEIKADVKGKIVEILVNNAEPVEFGQPLFKVEVSS